MTGNWVQCEFDCLPLRSIPRLDVPVDASPKYEQFLLRIKSAIGRHGLHNSYYLHRGRCVYHLTNESDRGRIVMSFEGTALTDTGDRQTRHLDLTVDLAEESCPWLNERIVEFWKESVRQAVRVEFNRYIAAGDVAKTEARLKELAAQEDQEGGFIGMYL